MSKEAILKGTINSECICHDIYKSRKMVDPECAYCNYWDYVLEDMEEYAKEVSLGFAEWKDKNYEMSIRKAKVDLYFSKEERKSSKDDLAYLTLPELYQLYRLV